MKTIKVRIACAVDSNGKWCSMGWSNEEDAMLEMSSLEHVDDYAVVHWIEAEVPVPGSEVIQGKVK